MADLLAHLNVIAPARDFGLRAGQHVHEAADALIGVRGSEGQMPDAIQKQGLNVGVDQVLADRRGSLTATRSMQPLAAVGPDQPTAQMIGVVAGVRLGRMYGPSGVDASPGGAQMRLATVAARLRHLADSPYGASAEQLEMAADEIEAVIG